ncbi:hypothetical protein HDV04_001676 [Boothiomyces sp. JEL0838]|nr:hypothetical protein HDV04_001676 [Boothiomyces sp. JEL0838]
MKYVFFQLLIATSPWVKKFDAFMIKKELSKSRTKNWADTVLGQSRLKKEQREAERLSKIAAEKEKSDEEKREVLQRRNNAIERARRLQYMETDIERELQLNLKESRKNAGLAEEMSYQLQKYQAEKINEETKAIEKFTQRINLARENLKQIQEKKIQQDLEKQNEIKHGMQLLRDAQHYKEQQIALQDKKRAEHLKFRKELDQMRQDAENQRHWEEYQDYEEELKIQKWNAFKDYQNNMKKQIEEKWFKSVIINISESLHSRSKIGESVRQKEVNETEKQMEIQRKQELLSQKKTREEFELKLRKKQELNKSMKEFYELHKRNKAKQMEEEKQKDLEMLEEYKKVEKEVHEAKLKQRAKVIQTNLELQEFNLNLAKQKQMKNSDALELDLSQDNIKFQNYMIEVANEPWALKNPRIQEYVKKQLKKSAAMQVKPSKESSKTHRRLGFQGHQYSVVDLAGSNDVVKGQYLDMLVNGQKFKLQNKN